jgi:ElaB/YqjD/DUF883 family membrane-anchored ribosome-binding protein
MNNATMTADELTELRRDFDRLRSDFRAVRGDLSDLRHDAVRTAKAGVVDARERIEDAVDYAAAKGKQSVETVEEQVAVHPFLSLGAALTAGFVLGFALTRRR